MKRTRQDLMRAETVKAGLLYDTAKFKQDESILIHIRGEDCAAVEARYHQKCYLTYTKEYANMLAKNTKQKKKENYPTTTPLEQFYSDIIVTRMISGGDVFTLKKLHELLQNYDKELNFTTARLKEKLKSKFPSLIFHPSKCKNKSDLVYNDDLTVGNVIDASIVADDLTSPVEESSQDELSQDELLQDEQSQDEQHKTSLPSHIQKRELYHSAMFLRNILSKINVDLPWPPDSNDLDYKNAAQTIPTELKHFLSLLLGFTTEPLSEKLLISEEQEKKIISIAQDLIHISTSGRTITHKALALGVTARQITGSQRLVKILNQFGHSCSPDVLYKHDAALTKSITEESVFVPRNIVPKIPTTLVWDNNDFSEETLSGKGTTHVANGIIIQNRSLRDPVHPREKITVPKSTQSVSPPSTLIEPYILVKKVSPDFTKVKKDILKPVIPFLQVDEDNHKS